MSDEAPLHHPVDSALAVAEALTDTTPPSLTKVFGGKLVFGSDGCTPGAGATITKDDLKFGIAMLSHSVEDTRTRLESSLMWSLGDLIIMLRDNYADADDVLGEAVAVTGYAKEACIIAERLSRRYPQAERIAGLSHTHHRELLNYPEVDSTTRASIVSEVLRGELLSCVTTPDGRKIERRKPLSCATMRRMLRDAAGRSSKKADDDRPIYLYIVRESCAIDGVPVESFTLTPHFTRDGTVDRDLADRSNLIIHLPTMKVVDPDTLTPTTDVREYRPSRTQPEPAEPADGDHPPGV